MDAIVGVWLSSIVGAAAFCAAGYVLGQQTKPASSPVVLAPAPSPDKKKKKKKRADEPPSIPDVVAAAVTLPDSEPAVSVKPEPPPNGEKPKPDQHTALTAPPKGPDAEVGTSAKNTAFPPAPRPPSFVDDDEVPDRPTVVPAMATQEAMLQNSVVTVPPPPRTPSLRSGSGAYDHDATRAMIHDALAQVEQAAEQTRTLEIARGDLQRQLDAAKKELKDEIVQRAAAEARSEELADRLAKASEESATLRHRVNMLDRQTKLLRDSLKTTNNGEGGRRRDIEEAEEMRLKLRDVVNKLERASMPPPSVGGPQSQRATLPPVSRPIPTPPGMPRSLQPASDDAIILREEIARLAQENRALRAQTLGSLPPKSKKTGRDSVPDLDLDRYRSVMEKLGSVAGLRGAVLADDVGSLILGTGDLAESLAAFGAYIRDAGARTDRLLPLDGVDEVDIRDRAGMLLSTRVVLHEPTALSLVFLASADPSFAAAKKIIEDTLRL